MSKTVQIGFDNENQKISINGLQDTSIYIEYLADVDFTEFISHLTNLIDVAEEIDLTIADFDEQNSKLKIVVETIQSIVEKYTQSIAIIAENEDDDLPFG